MQTLLQKVKLHFARNEQKKKKIVRRQDPRLNFFPPDLPLLFLGINKYCNLKKLNSFKTLKMLIQTVRSDYWMVLRAIHGALEMIDF